MRGDWIEGEMRPARELPPIDPTTHGLALARIRCEATMLGWRCAREKGHIGTHASAKDDGSAGARWT